MKNDHRILVFRGQLVLREKVALELKFIGEILEL